MKARIINSSHAKNISGSIEVDANGNVDRVITVETDLPLDCSNPRYDKDALDALVAELQASMGDVYDRGVLKQAPSQP